MTDSGVFSSCVTFARKLAWRLANLRSFLAEVNIKTKDTMSIRKAPPSRNKLRISDVLEALTVGVFVKATSIFQLSKKLGKDCLNWMLLLLYDILGWLLAIIVSVVQSRIHICIPECCPFPKRSCKFSGRYC